MKCYILYILYILHSASLIICIFVHWTRSTNCQSAWFPCRRSGVLGSSRVKPTAYKIGPLGLMLGIIRIAHGLVGSVSG